jgi:hypothetical protein
MMLAINQPISVLMFVLFLANKGAAYSEEQPHMALSTLTVPICTHSRTGSLVQGFCGRVGRLNGKSRSPFIQSPERSRITETQARYLKISLVGDLGIIPQKNTMFAD